MTRRPRLSVDRSSPLESRDARVAGRSRGALGSSEVVVESARTSDAARVAQLMAAMHHPWELRYTIWASPHIAQYVRDRMAGEGPADAPDFSVIRRGDHITGAIHTRTIDDEIFVDGIYVEPSARKVGLSYLLVHATLERYGRRHASRRVGFDGVQSKAAVCAWQRRVLGAIEVRRRSWWRVPLPRDGRAEGEIRGREEAEAMHRRWGFSTFGVTTAKGAYSIGRLPGPFYRLEDRRGVDDLALLRTLAFLDPKRELCVTGEGDWKPPEGKLIDVLIRSHVDYVEIMRRVKSLIPSWLLADEDPSSPA